MMDMSFPKIMGILNVTEDSFSDGGSFVYPEKAIVRAREMIHQGADIIDIGAESTRPGAKTIPAETEWQRIEPVLQVLKQEFPRFTVSIDTQKSYVATRAIERGADIINDISALTWDPQMVMVLRQNPKIGLILMHMQGRPQNMQTDPQYNDVVAEVFNFLQARIRFAIGQGIDASMLMIDPGIGFGKTLEHNLELLRNLEKFKTLGCPIVLGASRKSFINSISPALPSERLGGSLAAATIACLGKADYIRVHSVFEHRQFLNVLRAVYPNGGV